MGLCVPDKCGIEDIQSLLPEFLGLVNSIAIPYEFSHIASKNQTNPVLLLEDLKVIDSERINKEVTKIRFGNILMIILLISIGVAVIGSTFFGWSEEKKMLKDKQLEKAKVAE